MSKSGSRFIDISFLSSRVERLITKYYYVGFIFSCHKGVGTLSWNAAVTFLCIIILNAVSSCEICTLKFSQAFSYVFNVLRSGVFYFLGKINNKCWCMHGCISILVRRMWIICETCETTCEKWYILIPTWLRLATLAIKADDVVPLV